MAVQKAVPPAANIGDHPRVVKSAGESPLCVDLDGTLIRSDLFIESLFAALRADFSFIFRLPFILARGRAALKAELAERSVIDSSRLPYNDTVLSFIREQRKLGRQVVLASASHRRLVESVASHLGLFDAVEATEGDINLKAERKAERLVARFGDKGFDYIGDCAADIPVWAHARRKLVVGNRWPASEWDGSDPPIHLATVSPKLRDIVDQMRIYQWVKNLLVFTVPIATLAFADIDIWIRASLAFLAFGFCASGVYVLNDLLDLQADRADRRKRQRPFASGRLPLALGVNLVPLLLLAAAIVAALLPPLFSFVLATYFVTTCAYSFWLKRKMLVDVFALASLYTLRLMAGAAAVSIFPSYWLLAFSMLLFLSLAMVKRYAELVESQVHDRELTPGRFYRESDLDVLASLGCSSAFAAVLVLAFYINSAEVMPAYRIPEAMWLLCPLLLYWLSRLWIMSRRGWVDDDPILFAFRDNVSRIVAGLGGIVFLVAVFGPPTILH